MDSFTIMTVPELVTLWLLDVVIVSVTAAAISVRPVAVVELEPSVVFAGR
jgi:hypothetical protein